MSWKADQLQIVLFIMPSTPQVDALQAFQQATGGAPDGYQKPATSPMAVSQANGIIDNKQLVAQSQLGRIDLLLSKPGSINNISEEPPRLDDLETSLGILCDYAEKILSTHATSRVALLTNNSKICTSHEEARDLLTACAGGVWFPLPPTDAVYQFNAKKNFEERQDIEMNRIINWSAGVAHFATINMLQAQVATAQVQKLLPLVALKTDFNSATATNISIHAPALLKEIAEQTKISIAKGIEAFR